MKTSISYFHLLLLFVCFVNAAPQRAHASSATQEELEEIIDPEEVVEDEEELEQLLQAEQENPSSLCVIREADEVGRFFFIPYVRHEMWLPCFGEDRLITSHGQFFRLVGRPELLAAQKRRNTWITVGTVGQVTFFLGGSALAIVGLVKDDVGFFVGGLALAAGGILMGIPLNFIPPNTTSIEEAEALAKEYNEKKRRGLLQEEQVFPQEGASISLPIFSGTF